MSTSNPADQNRARRGAKPGERRGGRQKGSANKVTAEVKLLAQQYGAEVIRVLYALASSRSTPAPARIAAARELLDRGYGKAPQAIVGSDGGDFAMRTIVKHIHMPAVGEP